ncbi:ATP-binding cassette domain-containing protein [Gordonia jinhuaensis]|uniref:ABC transporter ATP-binding protein n=1 Tax=Gordonia jinhuaensis TaxID=1517702 RepID=A0A916T2J1_9ACTN|nr:ABC transporter ATP-binding protein [Gordonia jinhuaensis]GGB28291.1 ABC transporter ATP-binding protein [Gordonia jinhuaensis]
MSGDPHTGGSSHLRAHVVSDVPHLDVDLDVASGQVLAIMGPNGSGKTTTLSVISGLLRGGTGTTVRLGERELCGRSTFVPPYRRGIALLAQDAGLFPHMTVRQNIAFAASARGDSRMQARRRVDELLEQTATTELAARRPAQLSGGQAQRVAIARALAAEPALLLLDEPFRALDVDVAARIRSLLHDIIAGRSQTTVFVTHDVVDALTLAHRLLVLVDGEVTDRGPVRDVLSAPQTAFTASLGGRNLLEGVWDGAYLDTPIGRLAGGVDSGVDAGATLLATFPPSAVSVNPTATDTSIAARILAVEPYGDRARIRCQTEQSESIPDVVADADWDLVVDAHLEAGTAVQLSVEPSQVRLYRRTERLSP